MKYGEEKLKIKMVVNIYENISMTSIIVITKVQSINEISFENLLIILPTGFISKNRIGLLNTYFNIFYNKILLDFISIKANTRYFRIPVKIIKNIKIKIILKPSYALSLSNSVYYL